MPAYPGQTRYAFRAGVTCVTTQVAAVLLAPPHSQKLTDLNPAQLQACKTLNLGPATAAELTNADPTVQTLVERLVSGGWLAVTVCVSGTEQYSILPFGPPRPRPETSAPSGVLSKFAVLHRDSTGFVLEHPLGWCDLRIHDARLLALLDAPRDQPGRIEAQFIEDLRWGGFLTDTDDGETTFDSLSWNVADLWFHRRSTLGERTVGWEHFGPTRWARARFPQPPARRAEYPGEPIALFVPDLTARRAQDPTLTAVVEDRISVRTFDDIRPVGADQLAELLYRTARTRESKPAGPGEELLSRPYPSAGGVYELELYPVLRNVAGLNPGMYHYDSFEHVLRPVAAVETSAVARLLQSAAATLAEGTEPQVLIVIAARTGRIMWTYEQIGYATVLKDVGALMQTIYLVATAMGLGACAQGFGDTAAFVAATGVDEREECSVGSMVLGAVAYNG